MKRIASYGEFTPLSYSNATSSEEDDAVLLLLLSTTSELYADGPGRWRLFQPQDLDDDRGGILFLLRQVPPKAEQQPIVSPVLFIRLLH